jgi:hypothetical protein
MKKLGLYLFAGLIFAISCRKEPVSWNSDWSLILIQDTLNMDNLVTDSILSVNNNGSYHLVINRDVLNLNMEDIVAIPDTVIQHNVNIPISTSVPAGSQFIDQIQDNSFDFDGLQLKKIMVNTGRAIVEVKSPISTMCIVTLSLPGVTKNGQTFSIEVQVPAGTNSNPSSITTELDLSGYDIDLRGENDAYYNSIQSQLRVKTDPNGGPVSVSTNQVVGFEIKFENLKPSYAQGYFGNRIIQEEQEINLDFMNRVVSGAIDIDNVDLTLTLYNGIKVGARARINSLEGINAQNNSVFLTHAQIGPWIWINQAIGTWDDLQASTHQINLTSGNSTIEQFIENLPNLVKINFAFELNPYGNTSGGWDELFSTSFVRAFLTADMPLALGMNNLTLRDTFNLKLGETGSIDPKSGNIKIVTSNAYSFGATLSIQLVDAENNVLLTKNATSAIAGSSSISNFAPIVPVTSEVLFEFNETEMAAIKSMERLVVNAVFNSPNSGQIANIFSGQFLAFRVYSSLKLTTSI